MPDAQPDTSAEAVERVVQGLEFAAARVDLSNEVTQRICTQGLMDGTALLHALLAERDAARAEADARGYECAQAAMHAHTLTEELAQATVARDDAIRRMADAARDAGRWRGISEGKEIVIKHLQAERDALRAALAAVERGGKAP